MYSGSTTGGTLQRLYSAYICRDISGIHLPTIAGALTLEYHAAVYLRLYFGSTLSSTPRDILTDVLQMYSDDGYPVVIHTGVHHVLPLQYNRCTLRNQQMSRVDDFRTLLEYCNGANRSGVPVGYFLQKKQLWHF